MHAKEFLGDEHFEDFDLILESDFPTPDCEANEFLTLTVLKIPKAVKLPVLGRVPHTPKGFRRISLPMPNQRSSMPALLNQPPGKAPVH